MAEVIRRHINVVYSVALRTVGGDAHLAEDVTQQVFVAMTRQARELSRHPVLGAWLHRATRNHAANAVRTERRRKAREEVAMRLSEHEDVDWRGVAPVLDEVVDALREADRTAVILRFFEQRTFAEIARVIGTGEDGARRRVERALEKLRGLLQERRISSSAAALAAALTAKNVSAAPLGLASQVASTVATVTPVALTPVAALMVFMTTTKAAVGIGSATAVLCGVLLTLPAWQDVRAERAREAELTARSDALRHDRTRLEQRLVEREKDLARLEAEVDAQARAHKQSEPARPPMEVEGEALLARHPALRDAFRAWLDGRNEYTWGPFMHELRMTPAQREAFMALLRDGAAFGFRRGNPEPNWYLRNGMQAGDEFYGRVRELLGEEGLRAFRDYRRREPARRIATQAAGALAFSKTPLQSAQVEEIVRVLAENGAGKGGHANVNTAAVEHALRGHLDANQREILRAAIERAHKKAEIGRLSSGTPKSLPKAPQS